MATFSVSHPNCGASKVIRADPGQVVDFDAELDCRPGHGCCGLDHHHVKDSANLCPGGHDGEPCANTHVSPEDCTVASEPGEPCPGGHCGESIADCKVCRAIEITVLDLGLQPAAGVGG